MSSISSTDSVRVISSSTRGPHKKRQRVEPSATTNFNPHLTTLSIDLPQTLSLFECCVCREHINPPILQCQNSHLFCQTCRGSITNDRCPTCRVELPNEESRNHSLEQMAATIRLPFPCKYRADGCLATTVLTDKLTHEELCQYRPYDCIFDADVCQWSGNNEQLVAHLLSEHEMPLSIGHSSELDMDLDELEEVHDVEDYWWYKIVSYKNQHFLSALDKTFDGSLNFKAIMFFIGDQRIADKFKYRVQLVKESEGIELQWTERLKTIREVDELFHTNKSGLNFDMDIVDRFSEDDGLIVKFTILDN